MISLRASLRLPLWGDGEFAGAPARTTSTSPSPPIPVQGTGESCALLENSSPTAAGPCHFAARLGGAGFSIPHSFDEDRIAEFVCPITIMLQGLVHAEQRLLIHECT